MADDLRILIRASLNEKLSTDEINEQIRKITEKLGTLKINVDFDNQKLDTMLKNVDHLQKALSKTEGLKVVNKDELKDAQKVFMTVEEAVNHYEKLGKVNITNKALNPITREVESFTLSVENADKKVEQLKFEIFKLADGANKINAFTPVKINEIDNFGKMWDEAHKMNIEFDAQREKVIQAEQKTRSAIQETINKERIKTEELEHQIRLYQLQAKINVQNATRRYGALIDNGSLNDFIRKTEQLTATSPNVNRTMKDLSMEFRQIETNAKTAAGAIDIANKSSISIGEAIRTAAIKFPLWVGISTIFYGSARALEDMARQIKIVDDQMTELNRVSENFNLTETLQESVNIADDLSQKITDVNEAMIQAARMGLEGQDLFGLARAAVLASSISDLTAEEALDNLSSTLVQFNMNASDAISIIDRLNSVDNDTVASTKDLSQAITKSGAVAKQFGVELNTLLGYTVATSEATRESGNIIGNAMKTWISRITTMKEVSSELSKIGVDVFDPLTGQVRRVEDVINDLATKWQDLDKSTKQTISFLIAGRHHLSRFSGMMENFGTVSEVVNTALNSQGSAMAENIKYQQSLDAQLNKLSNSWINFSVTVGESGLKDIFSSIISGATTAMNSFTGLTEATDGLNISLPILTIALAAATKGMLAFSGSAKAAKISLGWIGAILIGLELLATAFIGSKKASEQNTGEMIESAQALKEQASQIDSLVTRYNELNPEVGKSAGAQEELNKVMNQLQQIAPQLTGSLKEQGSVLDFDAQKAKDYADNLRGMSKELLEITKNKIDTQIIDVENDLTDAKDSLDEFKQDYEEHLAKLNELESAYDAKGIRELESAMEALIGIGKEGRMLAHDFFDFEEIKKTLQNSGYEEALIKINELEGNVNSLKERRNAVNELIDGAGKLPSNLALATDGIEEFDSALEENVGSQRTLAGISDDYVNDLKSLNQVISDVSNSQSLNAETVLGLIEKYPQLAASAKKTADGWTIEKDALELVRKEHLKTTIDNIANEKKSSIATINNTLSRLKAYGLEIEQINNLAEAKQALAEAEQKRESLNGLSPAEQFGFTGTLAPDPLFDKFTNDTNKNIKDTIDKVKSAIQDGENLEQQLSKLTELLNDPDFGVSPDKDKKELDPFIPDSYARAIEKLNVQLAQLETQKSRVSEDSAEYQSLLLKENNIIKQQQIEAKKEADRLRVVNIELNKKRSNLSKTSQKYHDLSKEIDDNESKILSLQSTWNDLEQQINSTTQSIEEFNKKLDEDIASVQSDLRDHLNSMADEIIDLYKESYEAIKDAEVKRIDNQIELLDKEIEKYEELYDARLKLIDDQESADEYTRNLKKLQDEQMDIQKQLNLALLNNDTSSKKRREELQKQLAEKTTEINELKHEREIELQKDSLLSQLDIQKKEAEAEKERLEKSKEDTQEYWDDQINNEKKFAQIREQVLRGSFDTVLADFANFKIQIGNNSDIIGKSLKNNIIDKIHNMEVQLLNTSAEMGNLFTELGDTLENEFLEKLKELIAELQKLNGTKTDSLNAQLQMVLSTINQIAKVLSETNWSDLTSGQQAQLHAAAVVAMAQFDSAYGTTSTYNSSTGQWTVKDNRGNVIAQGAFSQIGSQLSNYANSKPSGGSGGAVISPPAQAPPPTNGGNSNGGGSNNGGAVISPPAQAQPPEMETVSYYRNNSTGAEFGIRKARPTWADLSPTKYTFLREEQRVKTAHDGDLVDPSSASEKAKALHDSFNLNNNEKLMKLLKEEVVIQPNNFKIGSFAQDFMRNFIQPNLNALIPKTTLAGGSNISINMNIDKMYGTQQEADSFGTKIYSTLNRLGLK